MRVSVLLHKIDKMKPNMTSRELKILTMVVLTGTFFIVEIVVGYALGSLTLVADSFHMLSDVLGLLIGYVAFKLARSDAKSTSLTYGMQRAEILGALLNSVFLLALCFSVFIQACQRFYEVEEIHNPMILLIVGACGLFINIIGMIIFHEGGGHSHIGHTHGHNHGTNSHDEESHGDHENGDHKHENSSSAPLHIKKEVFLNTTTSAQALKVDGLNEELSPELSRRKSRSSFSASLSHPKVARSNIINAAQTISSPKAKPKSLNMQGLFLHVLGDALGSVAVIVSSLIVWFVNDPWKYYMDPVCSLIITFIIVFATVPLTKAASLILLQASPTTISVDELKDAIMQFDEVSEVHELHVWQLSDNKTIGSVHIITNVPADNNIQDMNKSSYMLLIEAVKAVFHSYGIHSTTVQVECENQDQNAGCLIVCKDEDCKESTCCPPVATNDELSKTIVTVPE